MIEKIGDIVIRIIKEHKDIKGMTFDKLWTIIENNKEEWIPAKKHESKVEALNEIIKNREEYNKEYRDKILKLNVIIEALRNVFYSVPQPSCVCKKFEKELEGGE